MSTQEHSEDINVKLSHYKMNEAVYILYKKKQKKKQSEGLFIH